VSVETLVPTGMARGDEVAVLTDGGRGEGTVGSARSGGGSPPAASAPAAPEPDPDGEDETPVAPSAPTTTGGEGRVTVAVSRADADRLLATEGAPVVVQARGTGREYELLAVLRRAGQRVRRITLGENDPLGVASSPAGVREEYGVAVLAVRDGSSWRVAPEDGRALAAGEELFVVGSRGDIERLAEVVA
jgi:hypothetical protein